MLRLFKSYLLFFILMVFCTNVFSQANAKRYEIDAKRIGVNFYDKDALPRSREFIRLDSTYYVGWYYEGLFKYDRAADYIGYKKDSLLKDGEVVWMPGGSVDSRSGILFNGCITLYWPA